MNFKKNLEAVLASLFGYMFIALSVLVSFETISRKAFNFSVQGADELGGYALAVGSSIAFILALFGRSHIRIDILHRILPRPVQLTLNWVSVLLMAAFGGLVLWAGYMTISDTLSYGSTAPTPWMTPLIYPQGVWYATLAVFAFTAIYLFLRATYLVFTRRFDELESDFHPKGVNEELQEELEDIKRRMKKGDGQ